MAFFGQIPRPLHPQIGRELVEAEITRLEVLWKRDPSKETGFHQNLLEEVMNPAQLAEIDRLDQVQLAEVIAV